MLATQIGVPEKNFVGKLFTKSKSATTQSLKKELGEVIKLLEQDFPALQAEEMKKAELAKANDIAKKVFDKRGSNGDFESALEDAFNNGLENEEAIREFLSSTDNLSSTEQAFTKLIISQLIEKWATEVDEGKKNNLIPYLQRVAELKKFYESKNLQEKFQNKRFDELLPQEKTEVEKSFE